MNIRVARIAQQEFDDAKEFYEIEQSGLGARFAVIFFARQEQQNSRVGVLFIPTFNYEV